MKVYVIMKNFVILGVYRSLQMACKEIGISYSSVRRGNKGIYCRVEGSDVYMLHKSELVRMRGRGRSLIIK